jgi:predicted nucleic acid-binding protein
VILVDTTVWIGLLRNQDSTQVARLRELLHEGEAALAPVIAQEILQGASSAKNLDRLRDHFLALPILVSRDIAGTHARAGALYARCRWGGITPRSPHDCLIAQTAIEFRVPLLHDDRDFERIAEVVPELKLLRS